VLRCALWSRLNLTRKHFKCLVLKNELGAFDRSRLRAHDLERSLRSRTLHCNDLADANAIGSFITRMRFRALVGFEFDPNLFQMCPAHLK
jgi:hypothetical protein